MLPDDFVPIAEETALVAELGRWVIDAACRDLRRWQLEGLPAIQVKVNISARHLAEHDLLGDVRRALHDSGVSPGCLAIELTETAMLLDDPEILASLHALRELGMGISLDDFGTGYSSLAYLRRFPFDSLKIDRSFVSGLPDQDDDRAIVDVILALAGALGLDVVGRGHRARIPARPPAERAAANSGRGSSSIGRFPRRSSRSGCASGNSERSL